MAIIKKAVKIGTVAAASIYKRRFTSDICLAGRVNRGILQQILLLNQSSEYGRRYQFSRITTADSFKDEVPLTTYDDYHLYIKRIAAGEANVLTSEPVKYFGLTSGTTGKQKMIPVTARSSRIISEHVGLLSQGILFDAIPDSRRLHRGLNIMNTITGSVTNGGIPTGAGTSGDLRAIRRISPSLRTSPPEVLDAPNQQDANYLHLLFALQERDLMHISSPFSSAVVDLFRLLEKDWPQLVNDLAGGRISINAELDAKAKESLEQKLGRDPQRAAELAAEFNRGFPGIARRIWPQLLYVNCVAGGSFSIYTERLRHYIDDLPIFSGMYGATEAMVGICLWPGDPTYVVTPRTAYHEFIPLDQIDEEEPQALDLDQLTRGECYEMVVTSFAGFYRYRLGDIIKVVDYYNESPVVEFLYRRGQLINLVGEKTSEQAVCTAVYEAIQQWGTELVDFTTMVDYDAYPCRYVFYVEIGHPQQERSACGEALLEDSLCQANPRYLDSRSAGRLGRPGLQVVRPGTFDKLKRVLINRGASANQVKVPRVIRDYELGELLNGNTVYAAVGMRYAG